MNVITPKQNEFYNEYMVRILEERNNEKDKDNYQEKHHIIPKCLNGKNTKDNLIFLYPQEHYYAHKLLAMENQEIDELQYAWWNMCHCQDGYNNQRCYEVSAEEYANARERFAKLISDRFSGENAYWYGKTQSVESKQKRSISESGDKNPMYGKHHTEETKKYISQLNKGKRLGKEHPRARAVICITTDVCFDTITDAVKAYDIKSKASIVRSCKNPNFSGGTHPQTGEKLYWKYIE